MAEPGQSAEDRTETATQRRAERAREAGNVPVSREVAAFAGMAAALTAGYYAAPAAFREISRETALFLVRANEPAMAGRNGLWLAGVAWLNAVGPLLVAALVCGAAAVLLQTNFLLHLGAIEPKFSRINPAAGVKRLFGAGGITELVRSFGKFTILLIAFWIVSSGDVPRLLVQPWKDPAGLPAELGRCAYHLLLAGVCAQAVVAAADLFWVRLRHARSLRMTKQDVRDEHRETEGNPQIKARIRRIRVLRTRRRMMAAVPSATVVVTNPTHYAVALAYDRARSAAPRIVAKGVDSLAMRIREVATANSVPVVSNPPLARALWQLELDSDIPAEHYKAVAEIIAYVWRLRRPAALN